jgi:lambda repressor-like predicted transcriptional regulator
MPTVDPPTPLRRARKARGLRLRDVADASGLTIRTVRNAELARHEPHPSSKTVIAQALEMDPRELWPPGSEAA